MSFKDLNKEQKQLIILGVMSVVVVVALGNQLLIGPAKAAAAEAENVISEQGREKESGERLLRRDPNVKRTLIEDAKQILQIRANGMIPPASSKEFWAQKRMRTLGFNLDLDLNVSEHQPPYPRYMSIQGSPEEVEKQKNNLPFWIPYSIEIKTRLSFSQLNEFIHELQQTEPYASVAVLRITPSLQDALNHNVTLVIEWPIPRDENEWASLSERFQEGSS